MKKIALAGNPNVGKSTIFNLLTGSNQHTGNWAGKTVENTSSKFIYNNKEYELFDLPGTYSLISHSLEEELARDFICYHEKDLVVVVCDSLCLERNLNLVLQILEITNRVIVVVNLMDEAKKKNVSIDLNRISKKLGVPVIGTSASKKNGIKDLLKTIDKMDNIKFNGTIIRYSKKIEIKIKELEEVLVKYNIKNLNNRWIALKLLEQDQNIINKINSNYNIDLLNDNSIIEILSSFSNIYLNDYIVKKINEKAQSITNDTIVYENEINNKKLDKILTSKLTGIPIMLLLISLVFWLTIKGANYPSDLLHNLFFGLEKYLFSFFEFIHIPNFINNLLVSGIYETLAWVVSVMLPPMVIFFPLFMLLEDFGYLPRIAFNIDKCFQKCKTCGKQALTMCMGFGCNAVGVTGCRIIDSKRERLIAIITNSFIPCNGRFPILITITSMFLVSNNSSILVVLLLLLLILLSIFITFIISYILSKTILKGEQSSFTLELTNYRKPQFIKVIKNSLLDKSLKILLRAVIVSIPAGIIIFLLSNIMIDSKSLLFHISNFLDPFGKFIGLDGIIIASFILAFPANELIIPIMIMSYMSLNTLTDYSSILELKELLINNNWTILTAINTVLLTLFHYPCSTTCLTIKKETEKWYYVILSIIIPLILGLVLCFITKLIFSIF